MSLLFSFLNLISVLKYTLCWETAYLSPKQMLRVQITYAHINSYGINSHT